MNMGLDWCLSNEYSFWHVLPIPLVFSITYASILFRWPHGWYQQHVGGSMSACMTECNEEIEMFFFFFEIIGYSLWSHIMQVASTGPSGQLDTFWGGSVFVAFTMIWLGRTDQVLLSHLLIIIRVSFSAFMIEGGYLSKHNDASGRIQFDAFNISGIWH